MAEDRRTGLDEFPQNYAASREQFLSAARAAGFSIERHPLTARAATGEPLGIDVARAGDEGAGGALIVSGGLHGVEGFFGSAVLTAALTSPPLACPELVEVAASRRNPFVLIDEERSRKSPVLNAATGERNDLPSESGSSAPSSLPNPPSLTFIHALNPWGFSHLRRTDERNVDLNRSFLPPGQAYEGSPPLYRILDPTLNPRRPPKRFDPFPLHALSALASHGRAAVAQAIAGGQHDFPQGLFYGGQEESEVARILREHLPRWAGRAKCILHLDLHTGLGPRATYRLLADLPLQPEEHWLRQRFGPLLVEPAQTPGGYYRTSGSLGTWGRTLFDNSRYTLLVAEFGTYSPLKVLSALRRENQAHHYCPPGDPRIDRAKHRLREVFCPESPTWRRANLELALNLIRSAFDALSSCGAGPSEAVEATLFR